jgi:Septum formation initiator
MIWRRLILVFSIALNLVLLYSLVWGTRGAVAYRELKNEQTMLVSRMNALDTINAELGKEIALLKSDAKYQEKMIRSRLNFVKPNEILYIFPGGKPESSGASQDEPKN